MIKTVNEYWTEMDKLKAEHGKYPEGVFDFLSIHVREIRSSKYPYEVTKRVFNILSPLILAVDGVRPSFENEEFRTKTAALKRAKQLLKTDPRLSVIVDCSNYNVKVTIS